MLLLLFPDLGIRRKEGCDQVTWPLFSCLGELVRMMKLLGSFTPLSDLLSLPKSHSPKLNLLVQLWPWSCKEQFVSGQLN